MRMVTLVLAFLAISPPALAHCGYDHCCSSTQYYRDQDGGVGTPRNFLGPELAALRNGHPPANGTLRLTAIDD